jgi:hypothetical protein
MSDVAKRLAYSLEFESRVQEQQALATGLSPREAFSRLASEGFVRKGLLQEVVLAEDAELPEFIDAYELDQSRRTLTLIISDYVSSDGSGIRGFDSEILTEKLELWRSFLARVATDDSLVDSGDANLAEILSTARDAHIWVVSNSSDPAQKAVDVVADFGMDEDAVFWDLDLMGPVCLEEAEFSLVPTHFDEYGNGEPVRALGPFSIEGRDVEAYLVVFTGDLLADLYQHKRENILSENVRGYLGATGKINEGILETISQNPSIFLAYNNGLSVTASDAGVSPSQGGLILEQLTGMHIVNGGQTTASLHYAKWEKGMDLSKVYVQAKVTVIKNDKNAEYVERIAKFANTQNVIRPASLSSNSRFQKELEELSRLIASPIDGTHWYYERSKNSYFVSSLEAKNRGRADWFEAKNPKAQVVKPEELAKCVMAIEEFQPFVTAKGEQEAFKAFHGLTSKQVPIQRQWKRYVAYKILWDTADSIYRSLTLGGYKAQTLAYTLAYLHMVLGDEGLAFSSIWDHQEVSTLVQGELRSLLPKVRDQLIDGAQRQNVAMYAKKVEAWNDMKEFLDWSPRNVALQSVASGALENSGASLPPGSLLRSRSQALGQRGWASLYQWVVGHPETFSNHERSITFKLLNQIERNPDRISDGELVEAQEVLSRAKAMGWPI